MVRTQQAIPFATHDAVTLLGDLYAPAHEGPAPVLIAAPGGGWLRGDRSQLAHWGARLAAEGIAVFVADYRRSINGKIYPENVQDLFAAARFVDVEASALGIDRHRMGLLGASAGGHLAALTALTSRSPLLADSYPGDAHASASPRFKTLVGVYGVYDLPAHWRSCQAAAGSPVDDMADRMMGASLPQAEAAYRSASPIAHVGDTDPSLKTMLIWGDSDKTVSASQSEAFAAALRAAGRTVVTVPVAGAGHFWFSKETDTTSGFNGLIAPRLIHFLKENLSNEA